MLGSSAYLKRPDFWAFCKEEEPLLIVISGDGLLWRRHPQRLPGSNRGGRIGELRRGAMNGLSGKAQGESEF